MLPSDYSQNRKLRQRVRRTASGMSQAEVRKRVAFLRGQRKEALAGAEPTEARKEAEPGSQARADTLAQKIRYFRTPQRREELKPLRGKFGEVSAFKQQKSKLAGLLADQRRAALGEAPEGAEPVDPAKIERLKAKIEQAKPDVQAFREQRRGLLGRVPKRDLEAPAPGSVPVAPAAPGSVPVAPAAPGKRPPPAGYGPVKAGLKSVKKRRLRPAGY